MSALQEIKMAIARLEPAERALLMAELFAAEPEPPSQEFEEALARGLADLEAGRARPISEAQDSRVDTALADSRLTPGRRHE